MSSHDRTPDADDLFADTRMTFGEHIEDLRAHLIRAIVGFCLAMVFAFFLAPTVLHFIDKPVREQLDAFRRRTAEARQTEVKRRFTAEDGALNIPHFTTPIELPADEFRNAVLGAFPELGKITGTKKELNLMPHIERVIQGIGVPELADWKEFGGGNYIKFHSARLPDPLSLAAKIQEFDEVLNPSALKVLSVQEGVVVYFKVALMTGFVLGSPWIFYQIWMFVAAGLYPHEKKYVNIFLPFSIALFLVGVVVCEWLVMTKAVEALLWFDEWLGFTPDLRLSEWLGFAIFMPLVFGISFQTPLVMLFLQRIGLFSVNTFRGHRRIAWFLLAIFAAVITPSVDPFSMICLWLPMGLLYELGIFLCIYFPGRPLLDFDVPESEELVEV